MKEEIKLAAKLRSEHGSSSVTKLRRTGMVPGVVYGTNKPVNVSFNAAAFATMQRHHTSENVMVTLEIEGDQHRKVLIREVQHHTLTGAPLHVDFYELSMTKRVTVSIPLELVGTPVGVTQGGGNLEHLVRDVEVECLPDDIVEVLELDVSALEIGDRLVAGDIPLDAAKHVLVTAPDIAVASVAAPRVDTSAEQGGPAAGEPEVLKEKKTEA
jgi:large subunit ribosomal protein L25